MAVPANMGRPPPRRGLVVGVDGSPGSVAALRWAMREAFSRAAMVNVVTAWEFPVVSNFGAVVPADDLHPAIAARNTLLSALDAAGVVAGADMVTTTPVEGHPAEVLMQQARGAELLVVGSRGHGRIFGALLGSVSHYLAAHAACPVVVIKPFPDENG